MKTIPSTTRTTVRALMFFACLLGLAAIAHAQTFVAASANVTLFGGSLDTTTFGFSPYTAPFPGVILSGTAISTITGKPVRHLWYGDPLNGFCRIDPEVDAVVPPVNGIGGHNPNITSCGLGGFGAKSITPGQVTFDAATNTLYTEDISRTNAGIIRFHYLPSGDSGQGSMDIINVASLLGTQAGINAFGGCPQLKDPKTGTLVPIVPYSAALGPDGNLYTGSIRDGAIIRILSPSTFNPATQCPNPNKLNAPGDQIQIPILSADEQFGSGHTFGLAFIGTTLFGADNIAPWVMANATQCLTPLNGTKICGAPALGGSAPMPTEILTTQVAGPQAGLISDAVYPTSPGAVVYAATFPSIARISNILSATSMTVNLNYGGTFSFITGMAADPQDPNNSTVYVGADPTQGGINGSGQIWQVTSTPQTCAPSVPFAVIGVTAAPGNGQATVSWFPGASCEAVTSYVVRTLLAGGAASGIADATVLADPVTGIAATKTAVVGLTNGVSYQFEVQACNISGCGAFSALSNVVALTTPGTPSSVTGLSFNTAAKVTWVGPAPGGSPIISYTISAVDTAAPTLVTTTTLPASAVVVAGVTGTGTIVNTIFTGVASGLTVGHCYSLSVHATNAVGSGGESAPSVPICASGTADIAITMSTGPSGSFVMNVTNNGPDNVAQVTLTDTFPGQLFQFTPVSFGGGGAVCGATGNVFTCPLGSMSPGSTRQVTIWVILTGPTLATSITNTATVSAVDLFGAAEPDPVPANNTASLTVPLPQPTSTTDIQVTGAAQNGNPVHGTPDVFTWQIKNNVGTTTAFGVTFTATTTAPTGAVLAVSATNPGAGTTAPPVCAFTATTVNCSLGDIAGGATSIVTVTAIPSAAAPASSYLMTGNAQLGVGSTDTNPANNSFTVKIGAQ